MNRKCVCLTLSILPLLWPAVAEAAEEGERKVLWVLAGSAAEADGSARHIEVIPGRPGNESAGDSARYPEGLAIHLPEQGESEAVESLWDAPAEEAPVAGPSPRSAASGDDADRPLTFRERWDRRRSQQEAEPGTEAGAVTADIAPVNVSEEEPAGEASPAPDMVPAAVTEGEETPGPEPDLSGDEVLNDPYEDGHAYDEAAAAEDQPVEGAPPRVSLMGMLAGRTESDAAPERASIEAAGDAPGDDGEPAALLFEDEAGPVEADPGKEDMGLLPYEALSDDSADAADEHEGDGEEAEAARFIEGDEGETLPIEEEGAAVEDEPFSEDILPDGEDALSEEAPGSGQAEPLDGEAAPGNAPTEVTPLAVAFAAAPEAEPVGAEPPDELVPDRENAEAEGPVQDTEETEAEEEPVFSEAAISAAPDEAQETEEEEEPAPAEAALPARQREAVTFAPAHAGGAESAPSVPVAVDEPIEPAHRPGPDVARPFTLTAHIHRLEEVILGGVQSGPLAERVDAMDTLLFGQPESGGLAERVAWLTQRVIRDPSSREPSLSTRLNMLEYHLINEIRQDAFTDRVERLETRVFDFHRTGPLEGRLEALEGAVHGDQAFALAEVVLPADTVFRISLNEDVGSKTNAAGDTIHFTVQEDVRQDGVLVLPRGAQGSGVVTKVTRPRMFGRSGEIEIAFNQVFSIDEEVIPTVLGAESRERLKMEAAAIGASAVGALALGPVGLVGGLFVKGREAELPAGTELYIQTSQAVRTHGIVPAAGTRPRRERPEDWFEDRSEDRPQPRTGRKEVVYAFAVDTQDDAS